MSTPTGSPPPPRPPLRRPAEGRLVAGVAAGLAEHLGIDVVIVRILFVVLTILTSGLGVVAYVLGALFIPKGDGPTGGGAPAPHPGTVAAAAPRGPGPDGTTPGPAASSAAVGQPAGPPAGPTGPMAGVAHGPDAGVSGGPTRDPVFWVGVGLLVVGALWLLSGPLAPVRWLPLAVGRDLVWPLVLIGFGLALWRAGDRRPVPAHDTVHQPGVLDHDAAFPARPTGPASTPETTMTTERLVDAGEPDAAPAGPPLGDVDPTAAGPAPTAPDPTGPAPQGVAWQPGGATPPPPATPAPPTGDGGGAAWTPPPAPQRQRSMLTRITLGVALVVAGILWLLRVVGALAVTPGHVLAAVLLTLGIGLLVGSVVGRARWLILPAALLLPLVLVLSVQPPGGVIRWADLRIGTSGAVVGDITDSPQRLDELRRTYDIGAGSLRLDLTELDRDELVIAGDTAVRIQVGAGDVLVIVPDDVSVAASARVRAGSVQVFGVGMDGVGDVRREQTNLVDDEPVVLSVDVRAGVGQVEIRTGSGR